MAFIIGGHARSGTTLLKRLCDRHPEIACTGEFRNFKWVNVPYLSHVKSLRKDWYRRGIVRETGGSASVQSRLASGLFLARYLVGLRAYGGVLIGIHEIETVLQRIFPHASVVGDKYPRYVFHLDRLANVSGLNRLIIYRDARDVVNSYLKKVRNEWRNRPIARRASTAEEVAKQWVKAIEMMERHADKVYAIRYEDMVTDPQRALLEIASILRVDPTKFRTKSVRSDRIGKHKRGLTQKEMAEVIAVAGQTMERLGYQV